MGGNHQWNRTKKQSNLHMSWRSDKRFSILIFTLRDNLGLAILDLNYQISIFMKYPILHYLQLWKFPYISYSQQESKYLWHKLQNKQRMEGN